MKQLLLLVPILFMFGCTIEEQDKFPIVPEDGIDGVDGTDGQDGLSVGVDVDGLCFTPYTFQDLNGNGQWEEGEPRTNQETICVQNGTDGTNGQDGQDGTNGTDGQDGADGTNGTDGADGQDGNNGTDGNDGSDGQDGTDGTNGTNGTNGQDGFSIAFRHYDLEEGSEYCEHGGKLFELGLDKNRNGTLEDDEVMTDFVICNIKCIYECLQVENTLGCDFDKEYVMFLSTDGGPKYFSSIDLKFSEYSNGSAVLEGKVQDVDNPHVICEVYVVYQGRTLEAPEGSPKDHQCYDIDTTDWIYYTEMHGFITELSNGHTIQIKRSGPAFQIGANANVTEREDGREGASGWFKRKDHDQENYWNNGDFNFGLCRE